MFDFRCGCNKIVFQVDGDAILILSAGTASGLSRSTLKELLTSNTNSVLTR